MFPNLLIMATPFRVLSVTGCSFVNFTGYRASSASTEGASRVSSPTVITQNRQQQVCTTLSLQALYKKAVKGSELRRRGSGYYNSPSQELLRACQNRGSRESPFFF